MKHGNQVKHRGGGVDGRSELFEYQDGLSSFEPARVLACCVSEDSNVAVDAESKQNPCSSVCAQFVYGVRVRNRFKPSRWESVAR